MKLLFVGLATLLFAALSIAAPNEDPDPRLDAIWVAAESRMSDQIDQWFEVGDYPRCIQLLRVWYAFEPHDYDVATNLGYLLKSTEAYDEELAVYVKYRKENPEDPDGPFPEANFYFERKVYSKIPALLEPTLKRKPHGNSYRRLAHAYERLGLLTDCVRIWTAFLAVSPKDGAAKSNLQRVQGMLRSDAVPTS